MVVAKWTRREVRALRKEALRLPQPAFGALMGYSLGQVEKWERATADRPVRGDSAQDLDTQLSRLTAEQRARFEAALQDSEDPLRTPRRALAPPGTAAPLAQEVSKVNRREFGTVVAGVSAAIAMSPQAVSDMALSRIGVSDAERVRAETDSLEREDQQIGGGFLLDRAQLMLDHAKTLVEMGEFTAKSGPAFTSATGNLAVLVGWFAYDCENHALARRCFADALSMANLADDDELTIHACLHAALQSNRLARDGAGSAHYSLRLVERARNLTHGMPSGRIHALIAAREASAHAILGDHAGFARLTASASREMDRALEFEALDECSEWLRFMSHGEVWFQEARGYDDLGQGDRAIDMYVEAIEHEAGLRNRVNFRARLAASLADVGDTRNAVIEGVAVLEDLEGTVSSARTLQALAPVRRAVHDVSHSTAEEFRSRHDQLVKAG